MRREDCFLEVYSLKSTTTVPGSGVDKGTMNVSFLNFAVGIVVLGSENTSPEFFMQ